MIAPVNASGDNNLGGKTLTLAGAAITVAALVMNNLYQRQRVRRESASPYGRVQALAEPEAAH